MENYINYVKNQTDTKIEKPAFKHIVCLLMFYQEQLRKLSIKHIQTTDKYAFEGSVYSINGITPTSKMIGKMKNIFELAQKFEGDVLEIGFNSGNSAVIFLLANPYSTIYAFDICYHSYVKPCVKYLNKMFNNRIVLIEGNSLETIPQADKKLSFGIDIYHIDGCHNENVMIKDMENCYKLAKDGAYLILDDTDQEPISRCYKTYIKDRKIEDYENKELLGKYKHEIGRYNKNHNSSLYNLINKDFSE